MLRNFFILMSAMFIGGIYYGYSTSKSKEMQNIALSVPTIPLGMTG